MVWRQSDYLGILIANALNHFGKTEKGSEGDKVAACLASLHWSLVPTAKVLEP